MHSHGYDLSKNREGKLTFSIGLNLFITIAEVIGGLASGSLSLLSDALHNLSDVFSLAISLIAVRLAKKKKSDSRTFGYKRAEILVALLNASLLIALAFYLFKEAVGRAFHPAPVDGAVMGTVAVAGLIANLICVVLLKADAKQSLNIRSSYLHLLLDAVSSVAVVLGAAAIYWFKIYWVDWVLSILISGYVLKGGYGVLVEAVHVLMQHTPKHINMRVIKSDIEKIAGIKNIHHLHVWSITDDDVHLEAHIELSEDVKVSQTCGIKSGIEKLLSEKHRVNHPTLQFEYGACEDASFVRT